MLESKLQRLQDILAYQSYYELMHKDNYVQQDKMEHPFAFLATANKDTM